jgi:hypothetical protein
VNPERTFSFVKLTLTRLRTAMKGVNLDQRIIVGLLGVKLDDGKELEDKFLSEVFIHYDRECNVRRRISCASYNDRGDKKAIALPYTRKSSKQSHIQSSFQNVASSSSAPPAASPSSSSSAAVTSSSSSSTPSSPPSSSPDIPASSWMLEVAARAREQRVEKQAVINAAKKARKARVGPKPSKQDLDLAQSAMWDEQSERRDGEVHGIVSVVREPGKRTRRVILSEEQVEEKERRNKRRKKK